MDESLLKTKGIEPVEVSAGLVEGYGLRIGERATLVSCPDNRAYGVVMDITTKVTGTNKNYAGQLLDVAIKLNFPDSYLDQIRQACT